MEYGIDYILKLPIEDVKTYLESASIIDILAILENIKKRQEMDYVSKDKIEKLEEQIKSFQEALTKVEKRINFATKTNAPESEIAILNEEYAKIDNEIDNLNSSKEQVIQKFNDKKQAIFTLACNMISNAPVSKMEDYRNSLITWLKAQIEAIETNKNHKEITTNTLLEERNYTKEDITVKDIDNEIKKMEEQVLNHELILNEETIGKIKSLRAKKASLEHETFTFVCTEKIKNSLKSISNDITKLQMELSNILNMDVNALKELILSDYIQGKEEIKQANSIRIYRSYLENIKRVPLMSKDLYRLVCSEYLEKLNSLENPHFEGETLSDLDSKLKELHNYIKTLEQYKSNPVNKEEENKFLYSTVRGQGLFELPFNKDKWLSYFGKYFESMLNDIKNIDEKNKEYISLINIPLKSKKTEEEILKYSDILRNMLNELYNKILSLYLKNNLYINVNVYDYRDNETFTKYLEYRNSSIDKEIASVENTIANLNSKKAKILDFINDTYNNIDTVIKVKLNSIINGTYVKPEEKEEENHHFFNQELFIDNNPKEEPSFTYTKPSSSHDESVTYHETLKEEPELESIVTFDPDDIFDSNTKSLSSKETLKEEPSHEDLEISPDSSNVINFSNESKIDDDIISFDSSSIEEPKISTPTKSEDNTPSIFDDDISLTETSEFKDLLEPKEVPDFNKVMNEVENASTKTEEEKETISPLKKVRGIKVVKQEPILARKKTEESIPLETQKKNTDIKTKSDAAEIKERILNTQNDKKIPPLFNPASSSDVEEEYNDTNAPIDLNAFLNGTAPKKSEPVKPVSSNPALNNDESIDLMNFLNQIETNDATRKIA